jgi:hypothetical protein
MGLIGECASPKYIIKANVSGIMLMIRLKLWTDYTDRFVSGEISTYGKTSLILTKR